MKFASYKKEQKIMFIKSYMLCALWTEELDLINKDDARKMIKDCHLFIKKAGDLLEKLDMSQCGHDFWLTRNGHGAGFWDRGYERSLEDKLCEISNSFGGFNIYG